MTSHQNFAELSSSWLKLSCKTVNKSRTLRTSPAYQYRTGRTSITRDYINWELAKGQNSAELSSVGTRLSCKAVKLPRTRLRTLSYHYRLSDIEITFIHKNWEVTTCQNYAQLSSRNYNYLCKAFNSSRTPRGTAACQYGPSCMLIIIVYDNLQTSTC